MDKQTHIDGYEGKVAAVLDTRQLAMRCLELEKDLQRLEQRNTEQCEELSVLNQEKDELRRFADIGRDEIARKKQDALSALRAIVHFTGERERLQTVERMFADPKTTPGEIIHWSQTISEEFRSLYPNRPSSRVETERGSVSSTKRDWDAFRICPD